MKVTTPLTYTKAKLKLSSWHYTGFIFISEIGLTDVFLQLASCCFKNELQQKTELKVNAFKLMEKYTLKHHCSKVSFQITEKLSYLSGKMFTFT